MVRGCLANYSVLHGLLVQQHQAASHKPYPWEYWPREEGRSECGYVGLVNLGATCYMVSVESHLYNYHSKGLVAQSNSTSLPLPSLPSFFML